MTALVEHDLRTPDDGTCRLRVVRARRDDLTLADTLVAIDLESFLEATFSRYTAAALLAQGEVLLLQADDEIVGAACCMRCWDRPHEAQLLTLGIRAGWRGRGLGQRFVGWVLDALDAEGVAAINVLVGASNVRALRTYRDLGFDVVREHGEDAVTGERLLELRARLGATLGVASTPQV